MTNLTDLKRTLKLVCHKTRQHDRLPDFFLLSDDERLPDPGQLIHLMPHGSAIILRHRDPVIRKKLAFALIAQCHKHKVTLLIAEDTTLALACRADGIHFSEESIRRDHHATRRAIHHANGHGWIISAAAHSYQAALRAQKSGIHAILLSPVFPTKSHPGKKPLGFLTFSAISHMLKTPVYALGGIQEKQIKRLKNCPLYGIAGIDYIAKTLNQS